jgi:lysophospholipase L1-like esterase
MTKHFQLCLVLLMGSAMAGTAIGETSFKFSFGSVEAIPGHIKVLPEISYTAQRGYGFEPGSAAAMAAKKPFYFSVKMPEGNYQVTVSLGDATGESETTVKAELRRLMVEKVRTETGEFASRSFVVNVRTPQIPSGGEVRLKDREKTTEAMAWDDKLTLEFNGARPCLRAIEIERVDVPTVYLLGDSTVCDQPAEPWGSWGQMLPRFFKPGIAIANHAESGESLNSSVGAHRLDKIFSTLKTGDYLFIQFGHNDQKEPGTNLAFTTFKEGIKNVVGQTRKHGGTPVLVTSMERKNGVTSNTLGDYPEAMRQVAAEESVALIDLNAMSKVMYKALGPELDKAFQDGTHHNNYGSYELARCVVLGIQMNHLDELAKFLTDELGPFDPSHPDPVTSFRIPASPATSSEKPLGN